MRPPLLRAQLEWWADLVGSSWALAPLGTWPQARVVDSAEALERATRPPLAAVVGWASQWQAMLLEAHR